MNKIKFVFVIITCVANYLGAAFIETEIGKGAKGTAMGTAYTAYSFDSSAIYWNAAALSEIKENQISFSYNKWFLDSSYKGMEAAFKMGGGTFGAGFSYVDLGEFNYIDEDGFLTGKTVKPFVMGATIAYGTQVMSYYEDETSASPSIRLMSGLGLRYILNNDGYDIASAIMLDFGTVFSYRKYFDIGIAIRSIGISDTAEGTVPSVNAGISGFVINDSIKKLRLSSDVHLRLDNTAEYCAGAELAFVSSVFFRAGYVYSPDYKGAAGSVKGFNGGAGIRIDNFSIDYAAASYGGLGINHSVNLYWYFN